MGRLFTPHNYETFNEINVNKMFISAVNVPKENDTKFKLTTRKIIGTTFQFITSVINRTRICRLKRAMHIHNIITAIATVTPWDMMNATITPIRI